MPDVKLHPLREILGQRQPPLCIAEEASIHEALRLMTEHRYAQLPVVDLAGMLVGMVNQPAILSMYYYTNGDVSLFDLPLHHVLDPAATLPEADTFFQAVNLLTSPGIAAAVIVRDLQPIGILTGKDMTGIFRTLCESIILVERIEQTLRAHVATVFPTEDQLNAAAIATFGQDPENPQYAVRNPHRLSFGDRVMLIADDDNWSRFEPVLGPRVVFLHLMERVRQVRNELMHFRGQLEPLERDLLMRAQSWLAQRPLWPK